MFKLDKIKLKEFHIPRRFLEWGVVGLAILICTVLAVSFWFNFTTGPVQDVGSLDYLEESKVNLEIIYDLSGSMWGEVDGQRKYEVGQELIKEIIANLPDNVALGLRLIGATTEKDPWDTNLVVKPQVSSREGQISILEEVRPKGMSPLGYALQEAGKDLANLPGERHIILVTDGKDNGLLPPARIVQELKGMGIRVHVFDVEGSWPASAFLKTLSDISGGKYFTSDDQELVITTFAID
ncbi:MAG: vWA domain-containing protein [Halanaerobium sp.]|nr:vWA domain-containing protein [Halanaerobium sp.]